MVGSTLTFLLHEMKMDKILLYGDATVHRTLWGRCPKRGKPAVLAVMAAVSDRLFSIKSFAAHKIAEKSKRAKIMPKLWNDA